MLATIISILKIMGWLGLVLSILVTTNIATSTIVNIWVKKEPFSWSKMIKGVCKSLVFYISSVCISIAFTILPYINNMISVTFGENIISNDILNTLSSLGVLTVIVSTIIEQGRKAIIGVLELSHMSVDSEAIIWKENNKE